MTSKARTRELFWEARQRAGDTEMAVDFVRELGFEAGYAAAMRKVREIGDATKSLRNKLAAIKKAERHRLRALTRETADVRKDTRVRRRATPVIEAVARRHDMTVRAMLQRPSAIIYINARHEACWLLRETGMSYDDIATATERDDHTTAMHAVARVEARIAERPELRRELLAVIKDWEEREAAMAAKAMRATG